MDASDKTRVGDRTIARRSIVVSMAATALPLPLSIRAQQGTTVPRVVWISAGGSPKDEAQYEKRMEARWRELGWIYSRNLQYEIFRYRSDPAILQQQTKEIAAKNFNVILAGDNFAVQGLLAAGVKSPVVVQVGSSLQEAGWVKTYARPGGQITGLAWDQSTIIMEKSMQLLQQLVPGIRTMGQFIPSSIPGYDTYLPVTEQAATKLNLKLVSAKVEEAADLEPAFQQLLSGGAQAVNIWGSGFSYIYMKQLIELCGRHKLPDMTIFRVAAETGALASYGANIEDLFVRAIDYADKILRGAKPGDLPVELPRKYEFIVNQKRASSLGLKLPQSVLALADEVIR